jgi:hypothetical protein
MEAKVTRSIESISISEGPTGYLDPTRTLGRFQSRKETVMSPDTTSSRSSRLNSTLEDYAVGRTPDRLAGVACFMPNARNSPISWVPLVTDVDFHRTCLPTIFRCF